MYQAIAIPQPGKDGNGIDHLIQNLRGLLGQGSEKIQAMIGDLFQLLQFNGGSTYKGNSLPGTSKDPAPTSESTGTANTTGSGTGNSTTTS